jgi:putative peptide zinc metalloprotease protein
MSTFSESWYRIADQRAALRPHVQVRRQYYRGELWFVLQDPINNQFFRLRAAAYDFIGRLSLDKPIGKAWEECLAKHPDDAPGQEDRASARTTLPSELASLRFAAG